MLGNQVLLTKRFCGSQNIYVGHKTTIVAFTCVPCVRTILTCVCDIAMCVRDIIVHAFLEFNNRTLYSFENTGLSSHSSVHRHNHIVYCNQREKTNGFSSLFRALWPNHRFYSPCRNRWSFGVVLWEIFSYGKQDIMLSSYMYVILYAWLFPVSYHA